MKRWRAIQAGVVTPGGNVSVLDAPQVILEDLAPYADVRSVVRLEFDRTGAMERSAGLLCERLHQVVDETLASDELPLILGGECTLITGSLSAAADRIQSLELAFFDAHGDFNSMETTPSGYLGGMCLAHACGFFVAALPWSGSAPFAGSSVSLIGGRALDPGEAENLDRCGVSRVRPEAPDALRRIREAFLDKSVWVHIDLDVVDPASMFAVSHPVPNGISFSKLSELLSAVTKAGRVHGVEICGYLPVKDPRRTLPRQVATALAGLLSDARC